MTRQQSRLRIADGAGTYALLLRCRRPRRLAVGRLGVLAVEPGFYVYVGSALGPGGVRARVRHHQRITTRPHWHVDYLRPRAELVEVWHAREPRRREHAWAAVLSRLDNASVPLRGFGSSDCRCAAHLFHFVVRPSVRRFRQVLGRAYPAHPPIASTPVRRPGPSSAA